MEYIDFKEKNLLHQEFAKIIDWIFIFIIKGKRFQVSECHRMLKMLIKGKFSLQWVFSYVMLYANLHLCIIFGPPRY